MKRHLPILILSAFVSACVEPIDAPDGFEDAGTLDGGSGEIDVGVHDAGIGEPDGGSAGCVPETDRAFCARIGRNCGPVTDFDNCDMSRTTNCGGCDEPLVCGALGKAGQCGCPETDAEFCARLQKNCGQVSAEDACGLMRLVDCGSCVGPETCGGGGTANVCGCPLRTCTEAGAQCGEIDDGCGGTLDCGGCGAGFGCGLRTANQCEQEAAKIDVLPNPLDLGTVPVGGSVTGTISIWNLASTTPGVSRENLKLQVKDSSGNWVDAPPEISGNSSDFQLVLPIPGYASNGIPETQKVDLGVKFTPSSDGPQTARIKVFSNDPATPTVEVDVTGAGRLVPPCHYEVTPTTLDFGLVGTNESKTLSFTVRNLSQVAGEDCELTSLEFSPITSSVYSLPNGAISSTAIPAGGELTVPVRFAPTRDGSFPGSVTFRMSSDTQPTASVALQAIAGRKCLAFTPVALDFGQQQAGCTGKQQEIRITNVCDSSVSVTGIRFQPASAELGPVRLPVLPAILLPGESLSLDVRYAPSDAGTDTATLAVTTSQIPEPYTTTISGTGITQPVRTDTFGGQPAPKMDVLLVVDDSCSMAGNQASLAAAFPSFIAWADSQSVDYRIAVTTSSICRGYPNCTYSYEMDYASGRFVPLSGGTRVITPSTPNRAAVFSQNVQVGTWGSAEEQGLRPAWLALQPTLLAGHNAGFLRSDADLAIVFVTDAEDQDSTPISTYLDYFRSLKGVDGENRVTLSGILPTLSPQPSGCYYDSSQTAVRLMQAVEETGGVIEEICSADFGQAMARIGRASFGPRTRFFLSGTPDLVNGTISITLDGQPLSSTMPNGTKRWTYDPVLNAIVFEESEAPDRTKLLSIQYDATCAT